MHPPKLGKLKFSIILAVFLVNLVSSFECPDDCECSILYHKSTGHPNKHIKCSNVTSIKGGFGKRSPINSIDLSNIGIRRLTTNLENFRNLTDLDLSSNKLTEVNKLNKRIIKLNLSYNHLQSNKLGKIPEFVHHLDLSHNMLTYIPREIMQLTRLRSIELSGNPIYCNCETIEVRDWLTTQNVWSNRMVKCSSPNDYRGKSWLQVKKDDVCPSEHFISTVKPKKGDYIWSTDDQSNDDDLMMADDPLINEDGGSGSGAFILDGDNDEDINELDEQYMPVVSDKSVQGSADGSDVVTGDEETSAQGSAVDGTEDEEDVEGSGFSLVDDLRKTIQTVADEVFEDNDEGSGSGSGAGLLPIIINRGVIRDDDDTQFDDDSNNTLVYPPPGIYEEPVKKVSIAGIAGAKETISDSDTEKIDTGKTSDLEKDNMLEKPAKEDENDDRGVYILMAIVGIIFVGLLVLVIVKRKKQDAQNNKRSYDPEAANQKETELKPMSRNNVGKPTEYIPLMGEKPVEKPIDSYDNPKLHSFKPLKSDEQIICEPLLKKASEPKIDPVSPTLNEKVPSQGSVYDNLEPPTSNNNNANIPNGNGMVPTEVDSAPLATARTNGPTSPYYENINPQQNGVPQHPYQNSDNDDVFLPAEATAPVENGDSPSKPEHPPSRYSPVYSPETGRVKIKLTQTPKPKTPLLVNRSRSNAGDIITTPAYQYSPRVSRK